MTDLEQLIELAEELLSYMPERLLRQWSFREELGYLRLRLTPVAAEDACASASDGDSADRVPAEHDG